MSEVETHDCSNCGLDAARASRPRQTEEGNEPAGRRRWPRFSADLDPKEQRAQSRHEPFPQHSRKGILGPYVCFEPLVQGRIAYRAPNSWSAR
jgi:hypothetical protein